MGLYCVLVVFVRSCMRWRLASFLEDSFLLGVAVDGLSWSVGIPSKEAFFLERSYLGLSLCQSLCLCLSVCLSVFEKSSSSMCK